MAQLQVPRTVESNLRYRYDLRKWAQYSSKNQKYLIDKSRDDYTWWLESFFWLFEPRPRRGQKKVFPFLLWPKQREIADTIIENLGYRDIGIEKSRGMGASWICLTIFIWRWLFAEDEQYGLVSRNEETADKFGDRNSLGGKIDWALKKLPLWMVGPQRTQSNRSGVWSRNVSQHTWVREDTGGLIVSFPCTGDLAAGGRLTALLADEAGRWPRGDDRDAMSASAPVTDCRLLVSTYDGADGMFYDAIKKPSNLIKLQLLWFDAPYRAADMFSIDWPNQQLVDITTREPILPQYTTEFFEKYVPILQKKGFELESAAKIWSPWLINECMRADADPRMIAQEYLADPIGSGSRFFSSQLIESLLEKTREPMMNGSLDYRDGTLRPTRFRQSRVGPLSLWCELNKAHGCPPLGNYVVGADVATGSGGDYSSNSAISVINRDSGEKVAAFVSPVIEPKALAEMAVAMCYWFKNHVGAPAYLIFEANGPGISFRDRVLDSQFKNVYYRIPWRSTRKKPLREMGWWSDPNSKRKLLQNYRWALEQGFVDNPCKHALNECLAFVEAGGGRIEHSGMPREKDDPANAGANHSDRVIADALANHAMELLSGGHETRMQQHRREELHNPPPGSFAERQLQRRQKERKKKYW